MQPLDALLALVAIAAAASGFVLWWRHELGRFYRQRDEAEAERQRLVRRIDDVSRHTNDMLLLADADQNIIEANDRATDLLGYSHSELLRLNVRDLRDPRTLADLESRIIEERTAGKAVFETRYRRKDGSTFPVEVSARVLEIDGRIYHQGTFRDISDRKRAEEEHAFQLQLLNTLHDAVIGFDRDLRIRSWNGAAERMYGWKAEEVVGRASRDVLLTETVSGEVDRERFLRELEASGRIRRQIVQHRRDGARIEVESEAVALREPGGQILGYLEANSDVTERKQAEMALQASEAKFRAAFHAAGMGIMLLDREGRVSDCNLAFAAMLGYGTEEELRRRSWSDLVHPEQLEEAQAAFEEMLEGKRDSLTTERRYRRKDGAWAHAVLRAATIRGPAGEFVYAIGVVEDVTEKKTMEAKLLLADRMASMGTLAAGVAHEINNPLAFIVANISYALDELRRPSGRADGAARALEEALEGSARVREIVRDLRTFSRPDETRTESVDVRQVLRSSINLAQNEIHHRARLALHLLDVPAVAASPHRLGQVFLNLLINAAQAIPEGHADQNEIHVATRPCSDGRVLVEITDTGSGISPENIAHVFEPFFTTKPVGVGTGLGLSICHGIVTSLGGEIRVQSAPGKGSTFHVFLPAATGRTAPAEKAEAGPAPQARGRVLVVDDEAMVGSAIRRVLSPAHEVVALTSPREALSQLLQDGHFDVVLCDLMMPEMTGMELYQKLENIAPDLSRRMIFLTGGAFTPDAREFLARVPNARVEKPFEPQALRALVGRLVSSGPEAAMPPSGEPPG